MIDNTENYYWNSFYRQNDQPLECSSFAKSIRDLLKRGKTLLELGCGNARDAVYFSDEGFEVIAVDASKEVISTNETKFIDKNIKFINDDFTLLDNNQYILMKNIDYVYSRFTMHSIIKSDMERTFQWVYDKLIDGGLFLIEARSTNDPIFGIGEKKEDNAYINTHYRRFLVPKETFEYVQSLGFKVIMFIEDYTSSWYKDDHAVVLRIVLKK